MDNAEDSGVEPAVKMTPAVSVEPERHAHATVLPRPARTIAASDSRPRPAPARPKPDRPENAEPSAEVEAVVLEDQVIDIVGIDTAEGENCDYVIRRVSANDTSNQRGIML